MREKKETERRDDKGKEGNKEIEKKGKGLKLCCVRLDDDDEKKTHLQLGWEVFIPISTHFFAQDARRCQFGRTIFTETTLTIEYY